jgi:hypothetical protein
MTQSQWVIIPKRNRETAVRLLCFPYAALSMLTVTTEKTAVIVRQTCNGKRFKRRKRRMNGSDC